MENREIGIVGLGVMGQNLALNFSRRGIAVAAYDHSPAQRERCAQACAAAAVSIHEDLAALCRRLAVPRAVLLMIPAGAAVDQLINDLLPLLQHGDVIIDGGNSDWTDTERRTRALRDSGILFVGTGISGGEEGALKGPSLMPGGDPAAWPRIAPLLSAIAARTPDGTPCCAWVGSGGAGHFVKMVHNGIEYADMQLIAESCLLLERGLGLEPEASAEVFAAWNGGVLQSYLVEITAAVLRKRDEESGKPLIRVILDTAEQKGTGKMAARSALDFGVPTPTLVEAVFARCLSALKEERCAASQLLAGPDTALSAAPSISVEAIAQALYASKICSYAQGFHLLRAANAEHHWALDLGAIALLWRAGCIIRAVFLDEVRAAFVAEPSLHNLVLAGYFRTALQATQQGWREVVSAAVLGGVPVPALASALSWYDGYRSAVLPANLLQAQRDLFGAHCYERNDKPRGVRFHTQW